MLHPHTPLTYDSNDRTPPAVREFYELVRYRDLLRLLVVSSIRSRYKRSALGVIWTLLGPLLMMAVMTFAFSTIFRSAGGNYPVYVLSGLILWSFFSQSTTSAMNQLVWGSGLIKRIYVPRTIFAVAAVGNGLVNLLLALLPLALLMLVLRQPLSWSLLFLPVALAVATMFVLGMSLFLSSVAAFFTDTVDVFQVVLQVWFYLTPVMYPKAILPEGVVWFMNLNPMHNLLEMFRVPIYLGTLPGPNTIGAGVVSGIVALLVGWWAFTRRADELAFRL